MNVEIKSVEVIVNPEFNAAEIIITPIFSSGEGSTGIQSVSKNGTQIIPIGGNVDITVPTKTSDLTNDSDFVSDANYVHTDNNYDNASALEVAKIVEKANSSDVYTKSETFSQTEINNKLSAVYEFKGSVLTYAELPTNAENADVYNVEENGVNYAWSNELNDWDELGGIIGLATLTENGLLSKEDFALLRNLYTADEIDQLLLGFAKLSGGNIFSNGLNNIQWIKDFEDAVGNEKIGLRIGTISGVDVGSDTSGYGFIKIFRGLNNLRVYLASQGDSFIKKFDGGDFLEFDNVNNRFGATGVVNINGTLYYGASKSADTINDTRTSNNAGVKIEEICTAVLAGGANVKGSGTWIPTFKIDKNGFLLDQYDDILPGMGWIDAAGGAAPDTAAHTIAGIAVNFKAFDGNNTTEAMTNAFEITHAIDIDALNRVTTPLIAEIHTHGMAATTGSGIVKIFYDLVYQPVNAAPIAWGTFYNLITINANEQYWHKLGGVELTKPSSGFTIGDQIIVKYYRVPTDAQDTYAGDWLFKQCAMHMPLNSNGSRTRYAK